MGWLDIMQPCGKLRRSFLPAIRQLVEPKRAQKLCPGLIFKPSYGVFTPYFLLDFGNKVGSSAIMDYN
jgi:hypothetical protein